MGRAFAVGKAKPERGRVVAPDKEAAPEALCPVTAETHLDLRRPATPSPASSPSTSTAPLDLTGRSISDLATEIRTCG